LTGTDKVTGEAGRVLRTLSGYAVIALNASSGPGSNKNEELAIEFF
jgi:hypothetical protein